MKVRGILNIDKYPICSWVWAEAYDKVLGLRFGLPPNEASPDDMQNYVKASPEWEMIYEVSP